MSSPVLKFSEDSISLAFPEFRQRIYDKVGKSQNGQFASYFGWMKGLTLLLLAITSYTLAITMHFDKFTSWGLGLIFGISILAFALNVSHDAAHGSFSKHRWINNIMLFIPFAILGVDPKMWRTRHLMSHHKFPNVDQCDSDIDRNPFIRLSPHQRLRGWHRFQHIYAWILYSIVAFHATWIQDYNYMKRKELANMTDWQDLIPKWYSLFLTKMVHVLIFYILPLSLLPFPSTEIFIGLFTIQGIVSLLFILPLIGTHFSSEAVFPTPLNGTLDCSYVTHQVITSVDWHPFSKVACELIGGLNAHAAHHLFPKISHVHYPWISAEIARFCNENGLAHKRTGLFNAIYCHYQFLRDLSRPLAESGI